MLQMSMDPINYDYLIGFKNLSSDKQMDMKLKWLSELSGFSQEP